MLCLIYFYKLINNLNISPGSDLVVKYSSVYNTRSSNQYVRPFANTNSYSFSFFPRIISIWNYLPISITSSSSVSSFKLQLARYYN